MDNTYLKNMSYDELREVLDKIVKILMESNVYPGLDGKLYIADAKKIVDLINSCKK